MCFLQAVLVLSIPGTFYPEEVWNSWISLSSLDPATESLVGHNSPMLCYLPIFPSSIYLIYMVRSILLPHLFILANPPPSLLSVPITITNPTLSHQYGSYTPTIPQPFLKPTSSPHTHTTPPRPPIPKRPSKLARSAQTPRSPTSFTS